MTELAHSPERHTTDTVALRKQPVGDAGNRALDSLDAATTKLGSGVERMGSAIESAGKTGGASVQRAGRYLRESDPQTMGGDLTDIVRRHPAITLAAGVGLGLLIARAYPSRGRS